MTSFSMIFGLLTELPSANFTYVHHLYSLDPLRWSYLLVPLFIVNSKDKNKRPEQLQVLVNTI